MTRHLHPLLFVALIGCADADLGISTLDWYSNTAPGETGDTGDTAEPVSEWLVDLVGETYGYNETIPGTEALEAGCEGCQKCFHLQNNALIVGVLHTDPNEFWEYDYHTYAVEDFGVYTVDFSYLWTSVASHNEEDEVLASVTIESTYDFEAVRLLTIYDCPSEGMLP